ncbi:MAG: GNAT family N-acetyltransferase [Anaerolineae bacterium]|nr:GNAT family N-acetyltransferase [Anaerolineae bacterium]
MPEITYRPGTSDDSHGAFLVFIQSLADLLPRIGLQPWPGFSDPDQIAKSWENRRPLYEYLARTAEHFWVAEQDGEIVGYARSIIHDGVRELTEFFVKPGMQSGGVGRGLLARAFPREGAHRRTIIATTDLRAQARYLKSGVYPRFPIMGLAKTPEQRVVETDLRFHRISSPDDLESLDQIDAIILEYSRRADHEFLLSEVQGWLYFRDGEPVGYGYTGKRHGPFALLNPADFPAVLAHAENIAAEGEQASFELEVPMHNRDAVDYLLSHGFTISDGFIAFFMSDEPFGKFDQYIVTNPPFFI